MMEIGNIMHCYCPNLLDREVGFNSDLIVMSVEFSQRGW